MILILSFTVSLIPRVTEQNQFAKRVLTKTLFVIESIEIFGN